MRVDLVAGTATVRHGSGVVGAIRAADAVRIVPSGVHAGFIGADGAPAGKVRVLLDLAIANSDPSLRLGPPTAIAAPVGQHGLLVLPVGATAVATPGQASARGDVVSVELPGRGIVTPSADFDGDGRGAAGRPFAFFAPRACPTDRMTPDCFRYETFPALEGAGATPVRVVGFDADPMVTRFDVRLLVAADVRGAAPR